MTLDAWTSAVEAARTLAPAKAWRERLVREVRRASGARFVLIATCPPDIPVEAQITVAPRALGRVARRIQDDFLPRIEQAGSGVAVARRTRSQSYAPLLETRHIAIAAQVQREVLSPEGIEGMLNAFLASDAGTALGWISLGTTTPSREALRAHGEPLSAVAREAARTLTNAIDLAARVRRTPLRDRSSARVVDRARATGRGARQRRPLGRKRGRASVAVRGDRRLASTARLQEAPRPQPRGARRTPVAVRHAVVHERGVNRAVTCGRRRRSGASALRRTCTPSARPTRIACC